jgi:hypothetical protein
MLNKTTRSTPSKPKPVRVRAKPLAALETGQIWKAGETYIHIKQAGTRLVHYKMAKALHQPGLRRHLSSVKTVRAFLKSQRAQLLTGLNSDLSSQRANR